MIASFRQMKDYDHLNAEILGEKVQELGDKIETKILELVGSELHTFKFEIN